MYGFYDENYSLEGKKPEEEIPTLLKHIGYPYAINRSVLFCCGSQHNWPKLLGALAWMLEEINFLESDELPKLLGTFCGNGQGPADLYNANQFFHCYDLFLASEDEQLELRKEQYTSSEEQNRLVLLGHSEQETKRSIELANLQNELQATQPLKDAQQCYATLLDDEQKFKKYFEQLELHTINLEQELCDKRFELERNRQQQMTLELEKERLRKAVSNQKMTHSDIQKFQLGRQALNKEITALEGRLDDVNQGRFQLEIQQEKKLAVIEETLRQYNRMAEEAELLPSSAKYADGQQFELRVNPLDSPQILSLNLSEHVLPGLMLAKERMAEAYSDTSKAVVHGMQELDQISQLVADKMELVGQLERSFGVLAGRTEQEERQMASEAAAVAEQLAQLEGDLHKLRFGSQPEVHKCTLEKLVRE